ncbi:MAG: hypothetical protein UY76_C0016G0009 [Candidatus Uhrbacteria bacterium GW2011_GWA2_52_8d]|uniref:Uncharacterized protein n=1 Tax=Candidatus Uhrbacteria bacterium GW2011_GWA2_52_8d TaxID=1618979 RepID=A0A0G1ZWR4_9BACT|nr:MAG: hypothetical protein UY76_C0016G0009 [Candidatus Uhrbacteria bacterium GW2011_GWA2_52_8d]
MLDWLRGLLTRSSSQPRVDVETDTETEEDNVITLPLPQPGPTTLTIADAFTLDEPPDIGEQMMEALTQNQRDPFTMDPREAYRVLAQELMRRGMAGLVLDLETFLQEWSEGIEHTTVYQQTDGTSAMIVRGCAVHPFTEVVEYLVKTACWNPPTATRLLDYQGRSFTIFIAYGKVRSVYKT